jgi:GNAT superfamily N-acetyltransferase
MTSVRLARSAAEIDRCFPVVVQLRTHLTPETFRERVERQLPDGYRLAYVDVGEEVAAVAGFRISESLAWGRYLYVDDLVTDSIRRSEGHGKRLLDWLVDHARAEGCDELHLDSGVQRFAAHRFYLSQRMEISSHHFRLDLGPRSRES